MRRLASMSGWLMGCVLGLALVGVTLGALVRLDDAIAPPGAALAGLAVLAGAGVLGAGGRPGWSGLLVGMALALPGAALVGFGGDLDHLGAGSGRGSASWLVPAVVATIVVAAPLVADADRRWAVRRGGPLALAASAAGLYWCVPDTEEARVLLVVAIGAAGLALVSPLRTFGAPGAMAAIGLFVWIAAFDSRGRPAAFVGAVAALGLLVWEPLGARLRGAAAGRWRGRDAALGLAVVQLGLVAYASRVVGLERSVGTALVLAVPTVLVGIGAGMLADAPEPAAASPGAPTPGGGTPAPP